MRRGSGLSWLPDDSGLVMNDVKNDRANLWKVPFHGPPVRLTNFQEQIAYPFPLSPDGKTIVVARGRPARDAVLITNFR